MKIDFFSNYKIDVSFEIDNKKHEGTLFICNDSVPKVVVNSDDNSIFLSEERYICDELVCRERKSKRFFILYYVSLIRGTLYYKYLTTGNDEHNSYKVIRMRLTGLTAWLGGMGLYEFTESEFRQDISLNKFQSTFSLDGKEYTIRNDRFFSYKSVDDEKYNLVIEDNLIVENCESISLEEAKKIAFRIEKLFSVLTGAALSIRSIVFIDLGESKHRSMFFQIGLYEKKPLKYLHSAVTNYYELTEKNQWDVIFKNFFSKEIFDKIGDRFPYLLCNTSMAWEYDVFSVLAVFESCCQFYIKKQSHKLEDKTYKELKKSICNSFEKYIEDKSLSETDEEVIESIKQGLNNIRNTSVVSLDAKIKKFLESFDPRVRDIFDFGDNELKLAKKIRNNIAHGKLYTPSNGNGDITKEIIVKNKLIVVVSFTLLKELGLPDKQIVKSLHNCFNNIVMNSNLNNRSIDVFLNEINFIDISSKMKDKELKKIDYKYAVINFDGEKYSFNDDLNFCVYNDWINSGIAEVEDFVKKNIDSKKYAIEYINTPYIRINGEEKKWLGAVLVKKLNNTRK